LRLPAVPSQFTRNARTRAIQTSCNRRRFEPLLNLRLNQRTIEG